MNTLEILSNILFLFQYIFSLRFCSFNYLILLHKRLNYYLISKQEKGKQETFHSNTLNFLRFICLLLIWWNLGNSLQLFDAISFLQPIFGKEIPPRLFTYIHYKTNKKWNDQPLKRESVYSENVRAVNFDISELIFPPICFFPTTFCYAGVHRLFCLWCDHRLSANMLPSKWHCLDSFKFCGFGREASPTG